MIVQNQDLETRLKVLEQGKIQTLEIPKMYNWKKENLLNFL